MVVVGESVADFPFGHQGEGNTIGEAPTLIGPSVIEFPAAIKKLEVHMNNFYIKRSYEKREILACSAVA